MNYFDQYGQKIQLSRVIGRGGQATVYRVAGTSAELAKIYHQPDPGDQNKLDWMVQHPPDDPAADIGHASIAWPTDLIFSSPKSFAGYLMPYIRDAVSLLNVFNPRLRRITMPTFDDGYLYRTARNLAAAVGALHDRDYTVGDLNESNVLVTPRTLVTIIDTDSFQVRTRNRVGRTKIYPCPVGKIEYLPPELQSANLKKVERTPEHDRFALAVLIFQLLMDGSHPFRTRWTGKGDKPPIGDRIKKGWFPYRGSGPVTVQPAVDMGILHPTIGDLMVRTFYFGHRNPEVRPTPDDWENAIAMAEAALISCGSGHVFSHHLNSCPRCDRIRVRSKQVSRTPKPKSPRIPKTPSPQQNAPKPTPKPTQIKPIPTPTSNPLMTRLSAWFYQPRKVSLPHQLPVGPFRIKIPINLRNARFVQFAFTPLGWILGVTWVGALGGGVLGYLAGGPVAGGIAGGIGGLASGGMLGETIEKRMGWELFWSTTGVMLGIWLVWSSAGTTLIYLAAAGLGGLIGAGLGRYGRKSGWALLWTIAGGIAGVLLGQSLGSIPQIPWLGGALSGGVVLACVGGVYRLWRRYA